MSNITQFIYFQNKTFYYLHLWRAAVSLFSFFFLYSENIQ